MDVDHYEAGLGRELIQLTHDIQNNNAMQDVAVHDNLELRFKDKIRIEKKVSKWYVFISNVI